jgi:heam-based aerotactic trancducer
MTRLGQMSRQTQQDDTIDWQALQRYIGLSQNDLNVLHMHADFFEAHGPAIIEEFYANLGRNDMLRAIIERHSSFETLKRITLGYLRSLSSPVIDAAYVATRVKVGQAHVRVELREMWVLGSMSLYLNAFQKYAPSVSDDAFEPAFTKRLVFDVTIMIGEYFGGLMSQETLTYREEMGSWGEEIRQFIQQISIISDNQAKAAAVSADAQSSVAKSMDALVASLQSIQQMSSFLLEVSEQTNLLGLNAAIESARIGSAGRGFTVVAEEIRKLATRSRQSVDKISQALQDIDRQASAVSDQIQNAMAVSQEQAAAASELNEHITALATKSDHLRQ